jgi:hypothetical protein
MAVPDTGEPMGIELQGAEGARCRRAHRTAGVRGITHPPRKAAGGKLRRTAGGLHFLGGELRAEIRRSRLWSLKSALGALRLPAARPVARYFRATP